MQEHTNEKELQGDTAAPQTPTLNEEIRIQLDSDTSIRSTHCQSGTREQTAVEGVHLMPTGQSQHRYGPTIILTNDILWDYLNVLIYASTTDQSGVSTDQNRTIYRPESDLPFSEICAERVQLTEGSQAAPIGNKTQMGHHRRNAHKLSYRKGSRYRFY